MQLLNWFFSFWKELFLSFRDIKNYLYLKKICKEQSLTKEWNNFNLRFDWIHRIYTVVYIENEFWTLNEEFQKAAVIAELNPIFDYIENIAGLREMLKVKIKKLDEPGNYLVILSPIFYFLDYTLFVRAVLWVGLGFGVNYLYHFFR